MEEYIGPGTFSWSFGASSNLLNEAVRLNLAEDAGDLAAYEERAIEPNIVFQNVVKDLIGERPRF